MNNSDGMTASLGANASTNDTASGFDLQNTTISVKELTLDITDTSSVDTESPTSRPKVQSSDLMPNWHLSTSNWFKETMVALQKWEGFVISVGTSTFLARLVPILGEGPEQEAEIFIEEVDEAEREMLKQGSVFYWSIGYVDRSKGRSRESRIRFRRLPKYTPQEIRQAAQYAQDVRDLFNAGSS